MSIFQIKIIAVLTMVVDHIGLYFFPDEVILRVIGRLSFFLFAWLVANGAYHTKNIRAYTIRLLIFALISQIPFQLVNVQNDPSFSGLNIFFTLGLGLLAIQGTKMVKTKAVAILLAGFLAIIGEVIQADYGAAGVLSVLFFFHYYKNIKKMAIAQAFIFMYFYTVPILVQLFTSTQPSTQINFVALFQPVALISLVFIAKYDNALGPKLQYLFYLFYPLHLLGIYVFKQLS